MIFQVTHTTAYEYEQPISMCYNYAWLMPRNMPGRQSVGEVEVHIGPQPGMRHDFIDYFGNKVLYFSLQQPHRSLEVTVKSIITLAPPQELPLIDEPWEESLARLHHASDALEVQQYLLPSPMIPITDALTAYAKRQFGKGKTLYEAVHSFMSAIFHEFKYEPGATTISTPVQEVLQHKRGVCQDFAHLAIACLRGMGVPARYVSGYIETLPPPGKEKLVGSDASHAWFSAYIPGIGWCDFDPTNNQVPKFQHITVALGRSYADVPPLKGINFGSGEHKLAVSVDVRKAGESRPSIV